MYKLSKKKKELIRRVFVYALMVVSVCATVVFITLLVLGFRLNLGDRQVERYAFLQFGSTPSGATVFVDGVISGSRTPSKGSVKEGAHTIEMKRIGYETWRKTVDSKPGTLTWLNYALLVPKALEVEPIEIFDQVYSSLPLLKGRGLVVQHLVGSPILSLIDVNPKVPKLTSLAIPETICSEFLTDGVVHSFNMQGWDDSGRYLLVKHAYNDKSEWIVVDTQVVSQSKNISTMFNVTIDEIGFSGTNGNNFFITQAGDIRKLDIANGTMSKVLATKAHGLFVYDTNIVVFVGDKPEGETGNTIGLYRDGDEAPHIIRNIANEQGLPVKVATAHYFNQDYIAYSVGQTVHLIGGKYPSSFGDSTTALNSITKIESSAPITGIGFSPTGQYLFSQSGTSFSSFDIEYQNTNTSKIDCSDTQISTKWLNENYIWSSCNGSLNIREFDGSNKRTINPAVAGQAVVLTHNGRYLYSIGQTELGYQLQRVRMIIP